MFIILALNRITVHEHKLKYSTQVCESETHEVSCKLGTRLYNCESPIHESLDSFVSIPAVNLEQATTLESNIKINSKVYLIIINLSFTCAL